MFLGSFKSGDDEIAVQATSIVGSSLPHYGTYTLITIRNSVKGTSQDILLDEDTLAELQQLLTRAYNL